MRSAAIVQRALWSINRLRSMSAGEVSSRSLSAALQQLEKARVRQGWSPGTGARLARTHPLFTSLTPDDIVKAWRAAFRLDRTAADDLLGGRVTLFSNTYDIGRSPDWSRDPETRRVAPTDYGKTINYRDEAVVGNIKVLWEMGRQQYLVPLAVAYAMTGEPRYREAVGAWVDSWVASNPFAIGIHWCSAMEVALRAISWTVAHSLIALEDGDAGLLGASRDRAALTAALFDHGHFIRHHLSRHSSANNHLIGELVGLWCLAQVFDFGEPTRAWAARAKREIEREARLQVHPDGVAREQAVHYQVEVLEYLLLAWCVGEATGSPLDDSVRASISSMRRFLTALRPAGGSLPRIGDSDEGLVLRFDIGKPADPAADVGEAVERVLDGPGSEAVRSEKAFWYGSLAAVARADGLPAAGGARTTESAEAAGTSAPAVPAGRQRCRSTATDALRVFEDGGYVILADAGLHLVFDAGPLGYLSIAAHGHADALSICAAWHGRWWLIDPGTFCYLEDPAYRSYFRGTRAHNTITVDGQDQSRQTGPFMWSQHAPAELLGAGRSGDTLWAEGSHDGYRRLGLVHRRRIESREGTGGFRVIDHLDWTGGGNATRVELNFHFHPEVTLELGPAQCIARREGSVESVRISLDPGCVWRIARGSEDPILGWYSPCYGEKVACWTLTGATTLHESASINTGFEPSSLWERSPDRESRSGAEWERSPDRESRGGAEDARS